LTTEGVFLVFLVVAGFFGVMVFVLDVFSLAAAFAFLYFFGAAGSLSVFFFFDGSGLFFVVSFLAAEVCKKTSSVFILAYFESIGQIECIVVSNRVGEDFEWIRKLNRTRPRAQLTDQRYGRMNLRK
jgi:hypothetical protein